MPTQVESEEIMRQLAAGIQEVIIDHGLPKGFALLLFDFHAPGIGNYVSNATREDMIKALRETAARLEKNEDIGPVASSS